jgi:hypothetical protein
VEVGRARGQQAALARCLVQEPGLGLVVRRVEDLDAVEARVGEAVQRGQDGARLVDVPERMRPDGEPARGVDDLDRLLHRRAGAGDVGDRARHEVGREERVLAVDPLRAQLRRVAGVGEHGVGQVRAAERLAGGLTRLQLGAVKLEAERLEPVRHRPDPAPAVGAEVRQRRAQLRVVVAQLVAAHVEVLELARHARQFRGGRAAQAVLPRGGKRLRDAVDRVVIGQRHERQTRRGGVRDDVRGGQRAVGVGGVRLEIEVCRWHAAGTLAATPGTEGREAHPCPQD